MGEFLWVMRQLNMWIIHSAGRSADIEFCAVSKEQELGTLKEEKRYSVGSWQE